MSGLPGKYKEDTKRLMRRVQGYHDIRLDGVDDILTRAIGATVFDIGCNRGHVCDEFYRNGAVRIMGCDIYEDGINTARHWFADLRAVQSRFEVVDLVGGEAALRKAFGADADLTHDIVVMLATYHKLIRIIETPDLSKLIRFFGSKTGKYFVWRGEPQELKSLDHDLGRAGLKRIQTSMMSDLQPAAIWKRF